MIYRNSCDFFLPHIETQPHFDLFSLSFSQVASQAFPVEKIRWKSWLGSSWVDFNPFIGVPETNQHSPQIVVFLVREIQLNFRQTSIIIVFSALFEIRWWFSQIFIYFHPWCLRFSDSQFDFRIFFRWVGEKPPTRGRRIVFSLVTYFLDARTVDFEGGRRIFCISYERTTWSFACLTVPS